MIIDQLPEDIARAFLDGYEGRELDSNLSEQAAEAYEDGAGLRRSRIMVGTADLVDYDGDAERYERFAEWLNAKYIDGMVMSIEEGIGLRGHRHATVYQRRPPKSDAQIAIEIQVREALDEMLGGGIYLYWTGPEVWPVSLGNYGYCRLDGMAKEPPTFVEIHLRQDFATAAQLRKVMESILKLATLRQMPEYAEHRTIIAFTSERAERSVSGWVRAAADQFGVELLVVPVGDELRNEIKTEMALQDSLGHDVDIPQIVSR